MNSALLQRYYPKIGQKRPLKRSITLAQRGTNKNPILKSAVLAGNKEEETTVNELDLDQLIEDLELDKSTEKDETEEIEQNISVDADLIEQVTSIIDELSLKNHKTMKEKVIKQRDPQLEKIEEIDQVAGSGGPRPELVQKQKILNKLIQNKM